MTKSMTSGNPLKLMIQFAFPLLLGNLLQQTYNIIDAAIVGQCLGAKALASVGRAAASNFWCLVSVWEAVQGLVYRSQNIMVQMIQTECVILFLTVPF